MHPKVFVHAATNSNLSSLFPKIDSQKEYAKIRLVQCCRVCKKPIEEGDSGETFTIDSVSHEIKHYHGDCYDAKTKS